MTNPSTRLASRQTPELQLQKAGATRELRLLASRLKTPQMLEQETREALGGGWEMKASPSEASPDGGLEDLDEPLDEPHPLKALEQKHD